MDPSVGPLEPPPSTAGWFPSKWASGLVYPHPKDPLRRHVSPSQDLQDLLRQKPRAGGGSTGERGPGKARQLPKIGISKMKFSYFSVRHALLTGFGISVITNRVTNFLPKTPLYDIIFLQNKLNFYFLKSLFSAIAESTTDVVIKIMLENRQRLKEWKRMRETERQAMIERNRKSGRSCERLH